MNARFDCFITGTDTDVGKTLVSAALLHTLTQQGVRCAGMKPVAAGATLRDGTWRNNDAESLAAAASVKLPPDLVTPFLLRTPASPHIAASIDNLTIDAASIAAAYRKICAQTDAVVVEGVGGFRVPLAQHYDTADMAVQFGLPIVLVVGVRLGCLNHALLTAESITARGLKLAGWVANTLDTTMPYFVENVSTLKAMLSAPLIGVIPHLPDVSAASAASHLDFSCLPGWPGKQS
ncbi:MAG: dethiobiotin synthase [Oxalobacter sp.]|nr:MAG: dethiobiotin synthase [Oxalobacter sp.]